MLSELIEKVKGEKHEEMIARKDGEPCKFQE